MREKAALARGGIAMSRSRENHVVESSAEAARERVALAEQPQGFLQVLHAALDSSAQGVETT
jgi:hypothetical protein